ncbi:hypothetical protein BW716_30530 [[Flexibacter] sp. ATCC 35208]|nr:hypothetical protein BW716_30530 [[Flexibacter] sp. ATCC 35208]
MAVVLFVLSFFHFNNSVDFHVHDTYYVMNVPSIYWGLSLFFLLFWMIYHFSYRLLSNKLIWWHLMGIIISIAAIILFGRYQLSGIRHYYQYSNFEQVNTYQQIGRIIAVTIIAIQFLYPINLVLGLIKRFKKW